MDAQAAWEEFAATLPQAASMFERADVDLDEIDRAEGLRFLLRLTRLVASGLERPVDPHAPRFTTFGPPDVTFGIPNPDNLYQRAPVDPACTYRVRGRRNTVHFLGIGAQAPGVAATVGTRSHLDGAALETDGDGAFEVILSASEHAGNWIELAPDARTVMVRQTFLDRAQEVAADLDIECLDPPSLVAATALTMERASQVTAGAANSVAFLADMWVRFVADFPAAVNEFFIYGLDKHIAIGGDPNVRTPLMRWHLELGEGLVVDLEPPACSYWNIQLANIWTEPLEPRTGVAHRNPVTAVATSPGTYRMIVANEDPSLPNWLDAGGHSNGTTSVRWVGADAWPLPRTEVVRLADLAR